MLIFSKISVMISHFHHHFRPKLSSCHAVQGKAYAYVKNPLSLKVEPAWALHSLSANGQVHKACTGICSRWLSGTCYSQGSLMTHCPASRRPLFSVGWNRSLQFIKCNHCQKDESQSQLCKLGYDESTKDRHFLHGGLLASAKTLPEGHRWADGLTVVQPCSIISYPIPDELRQMPCLQPVTKHSGKQWVQAQQPKSILTTPATKFPLLPSRMQPKKKGAVSPV